MNISKRKIPLLILFYLAVIPMVYCGGINSVPVSSHHPIYQFLQRLENKGIIEFRAAVKPLSRGEIYELLAEARTKSASEEFSGLFTALDRRLITRYYLEFGSGGKSDKDTELTENHDTKLAEFREKYWASAPFYRDGTNFYSLNVNDFTINCNPIVKYNFVTDSTGEMIMRRISGVNLNASLSSYMGLYFDFRDNLEKGRGPYNYGDREKLYCDNAGFVDMKGENHTYYELAQAALSYSRKNLFLLFGRMQFCIGSGRDSHLILSDNPPPFDCFYLRYDIGEIARFTYLTGILHAYPEIYKIETSGYNGGQRKISENKFIAVHRIEVYPTKNIEIGLTESVIYGQRGLEPAYLNPINLYYSAEHNLGDLDNVNWEADMEVNLPYGVNIYGEFLIDDMRTGELGTDYWGNKFAYIGGIDWADPVGVPNTDFNIEYSRIKPFVYTHFYEINVYKNWNSCLGHYLPPNSDQWLMRLQWRPFYTISTNISAVFIRHGANPDSVTNAGGDIDTPPVSGYEGSAPFLDGLRINSAVYEAGIKWEPLEYYSLSGEIRYHKWSTGDQWEWELTCGVSFW